MRSPTVTAMRFQLTMVPRPRASATATFTHGGMNCVACVPRPRHEVNVAVCSEVRPGCFSTSGIAASAK